MSTDTNTKEIATTQGAAVALTPEQQLEAMLNQEVANAMQQGGFDYRPGKIKIMHREKKFVTADGQTANSITGTIVYFHKARGYWQDETQQIPTCSSMDGKIGLRRIGEDGSETETVNCTNCPLNQFGSDPKGAGKACKEMRRLFVVENDSILPAMFNVPPTSLKSFDLFMSSLVSKKRAHIAFEVTFRLEGAKGAGFDYSKVVFELGQQLSNEKILELLRMREKVVESAMKIGIENDDYMGDNVANDAAGESEQLRDDKDVY